MAATDEIQAFQSNLKKKGWHLSCEGISECIQTLGKEKCTTESLVKSAVNFDLKEIGSKVLTEDVRRGQAQSVEGPLVLQIQKVRNVSAPKANEESSTAPRLLRLQITDGHSTCFALENAYIKQLSLSTPPGTKIRLNGTVVICSGFLILEPGSIEMVGGKVDKLLAKWEANRSINQQIARPGMGSEGPPLFVAFDASNPLKKKMPSEKSAPDTVPSSTTMGRSTRSNNDRQNRNSDENFSHARNQNHQNTRNDDKTRVENRGMKSSQGSTPRRDVERQPREHRRTEQSRPVSSKQDTFQRQNDPQSGRHKDSAQSNTQNNREFKDNRSGNRSKGMKNDGDNRYGRGKHPGARTNDYDNSEDESAKRASQGTLWDFLESSLNTKGHEKKSVVAGNVRDETYEKPRQANNFSESDKGRSGNKENPLEKHQLQSQISHSSEGDKRANQRFNEDKRGCQHGDQRDRREKQSSEDQRSREDQRGSNNQRGREDQRVSKNQRDGKDQRFSRDHRGHEDQRDFKDQRDRVDQRSLVDQRGREDHRVRKEQIGDKREDHNQDQRARETLRGQQSGNDRGQREDNRAPKNRRGNQRGNKYENQADQARRDRPDLNKGGGSREDGPYHPQNQSRDQRADKQPSQDCDSKCKTDDQNRKTVAATDQNKGRRTDRKLTDRQNIHGAQEDRFKQDKSRDKDVGSVTCGEGKGNGVPETSNYRQASSYETANVRDRDARKSSGKRAETDSRQRNEMSDKKYDGKSKSGWRQDNKKDDKYITRDVSRDEELARHDPRSKTNDRVGPLGSGSATDHVPVKRDDNGRSTKCDNVGTNERREMEKSMATSKKRYEHDTQSGQHNVKGMTNSKYSGTRHWWKTGEECMAFSSKDHQYHLARILSVEVRLRSCVVFFPDSGTQETVEWSYLSPLEVPDSYNDSHPPLPPLASDSYLPHPSHPYPVHVMSPNNWMNYPRGSFQPHFYHEGQNMPANAKNPTIPDDSTSERRSKRPTQTFYKPPSRDAVK